MGIEFDLNDIASIFKKESPIIYSALNEAVVAGVIIPVKPIYRRTKKDVNQNLIQGRYRFAHDRIRQAVYATMEQEKKNTAIHKSVFTY